MSCVAHTFSENDIYDNYAYFPPASDGTANGRAGLLLSIMMVNGGSHSFPQHRRLPRHAVALPDSFLWRDPMLRARVPRGSILALCLHCTTGTATASHRHRHRTARHSAARHSRRAAAATWRTHRTQIGDLPPPPPAPAALTNSR